MRRPNLWHLAKGSGWGGDLYADCLAKRFGGRWLAETHMKTTEDNKLPATAAVGNVTRIVFPDGKDYGSKGDHSKVIYTVEPPPEKELACSCCISSLSYLIIVPCPHQPNPVAVGGGAAQRPWLCALRLGGRPESLRIPAAARRRRPAAGRADAAPGIFGARQGNRHRLNESATLTNTEYLIFFHGTESARYTFNHDFFTLLSGSCFGGSKSAGGKSKFDFLG